MKYLLDANIIIRFLVNDHPEDGAAVESLLKTNQSFFLADVVVAEIVWVLTSHYKLKKIIIINQLKSLIKLKVIKCNHKIITKTLEIFESHNIDYIDAYLAAYQTGKDYQGIYSFDKDFDKIPEIARLEP